MNKYLLIHHRVSNKLLCEKVRWLLCVEVEMTLNDFVSVGVIDSLDFDTLSAYDVADLLKLYFRELPDCLLTSKLSHVFTSIIQRQ